MGIGVPVKGNVQREEGCPDPGYPIAGTRRPRDETPFQRVLFGLVVRRVKVTFGADLAQDIDDGRDRDRD